MTEITLKHAPDIGSTVRLAADGDEMACARLVERHYARMVRAAFVIVGDVETAQEAVQIAWSIAWRRLRSVRDPERFHDFFSASLWDPSIRSFSPGQHSTTHVGTTPHAAS